MWSIRFSPNRTSGQLPIQISAYIEWKEEVILFFAEDLHGFYAGGAKRGP